MEQKIEEMTAKKNPARMVWAGAAVCLLVCLFLASTPVLAQDTAPEKKPAPAETAKKPAPARKNATKPGASSRKRRTNIQLRDPFQAISQDTPGGVPSRQLPPGKRGLVVQQLTVNGIVLGARGRIAVVNMAGKDRAFFLREGDRLYDGVVKQILGDRVIFRERSRDVFGNVKVRDVEKVLFSGTSGSNP